MNKKTFYITTPIYYVNDRPHIGHAYTSVACDVTARFKRLDGYEVKFLTGTDEHGQKVEKSARLAGMDTKTFVDGVSQHFREMAAYMDISNDDFIRTTDARHKHSAQTLWKKMQEQGHIYLGAYSGWYAVRDEAYYQESELVNGKAPTGAEVEWVEEPSYFFRLSAFEDRLLKYYAEHPEFIGPQSRRNEVVSFVKGGLKDLSVSRTTFKWGIPVPGDPEHIMYVWLDALANYLSAVDYGDTPGKQYQQFWPADLHMVGKDILRFHAVYWPAFLMAAGLPLPRRIYAHGWWTVEGEKMSKSLGNVIAPQDLIAEYGLDQSRWFLMREVPFGNDGNFSKELLKNRVNSELANNIGNLVQRTLSLVHKNCGGRVPQRNDAVFDAELKKLLYSNLDTHRRNIDQQQFHLECEAILAISNYANLYIDNHAPWALKKTDINKMNNVLYVLVESIRCLAIYLQPLMHKSSTKILDILNIDNNSRSFIFLSETNAIKAGHELNMPSAVFPRIE